MKIREFRVYGFRNILCLLILLTFSIFFILTPISCLFCAFKDPGWGSRPLGLAGAFTAVSDDSNAVLFNPAGLSQIYLNQFDFMYGRPFVGLDGVEINHYLVTGAINLKNKYFFGVGYTNLTVKDLYREDTLRLSFSYSPKLTKFYESLGVTFKWLHHSFVPDEYTKTDIVFSKATSKSALSFDIGLMARFFDKLKFGLSLKDINQPDVGLKDPDLVPISFNIGFAYLHSLRHSKFIYALDTSIRSKEYNVNLGVEYWLLDENLALRTGVNFTEITIGATYRFNVSPSLLIETSYAFVWPIYIQETYGTHQLSLGIRF